VLVAAVAALGVLAAVALANVTIYTNDFNRRSGAQALDGPKANACQKSWNKEKKALKVEVKNGPRACSYRLPVESVDELPDHDLSAEGKLLQATPGAIRDTAYIGLFVRAGGAQYYELRVFPRTGEYSVRRTPDGPDFPANGSDPAIKGVGKRNKIRLEVFGTHVRALVNGTELEDITDSDPGEIHGTKLRLVVGNTGNTNKDTLALLDRVRVAVPNP
jgi:hypothetical protein